MKKNEIVISQALVIDDIPHTDLHMHTTFCDGKDTPEDMVLAALEKGFSCIGFSGHSYVEFDPQAGMDEETLRAYHRQVSLLKQKYAGRIRIFCGLELDCCTLPSDGRHKEALRFYKEYFDYLIGSVHYIPLPGAKEGCEGSAAFAAVDDTPEILMDAVRQYYGGDYYLAAEAYYALAADVVNRTDCDIIGHFDLFSKFNQKYGLFDEQDPRYVKAWKKAADQLSAAGKVFEINTGGMSRGWKDVPYPSPKIRDYIRQKGGRFILSSDSHRKETIGYLFDTF